MGAGAVLDVRLPEALASGDLARACACLAAQLRTGGVAVVLCHADSLPGELAAVDALARLSLVARRGRVRFEVRGMSPQLSSLVELLGLHALLTADHEDVRG
jgi:hypothetical protein